MLEPIKGVKNVSFSNYCVSRGEGYRRSAGVLQTTFEMALLSVGNNKGVVCSPKLLVLCVSSLKNFDVVVWLIRSFECFVKS